MKTSIFLMVIVVLVGQLAGCFETPETIPASTTQPMPSSTSTETSTPPPTVTPSLTNTPRPKPTKDPEMVRYLDGAEVLLSHSSTILFDQTQSFADVCPERYIAAFTFQTSRTDRESLVVAIVSLPRREDGSVVEGEHELLWTWRQEGIEPYEMDRVDWIQRDEEWPLTLRTLGIFGGEWVIGVTSGHCPGDDIRMVGLFTLENPQNYVLEITRFEEEAPFDYWLQDGDRLTHYRWDPWEALPLSTLETAPGKLIDVTWDSESPDLNGDGALDIIIRWDVSGEVVEQGYMEDGQLLQPIVDHLN